MRYEYKMINPDFLVADPSYQRELSNKKVNSIVKNFDPNVFNEPKVSARGDGKFYVFDGDHSIAAHRIKFGKDTPIKCKVFYGLTPEEEMKLFITQNGISSNPTRTEKLRAMVNYNDPDAMGMINAAKIAGITVELKPNPGSYKILAPDTAFMVYKSLGEEGFINMLSVIKYAWNGDGDSFQMGILKGFGYIFRHCKDQLRHISNKDLAFPFIGYPVSKIVERAKTLNGSMERRFAVALIEHYNKRKRSGKILLPEK